MSSEWVDLRERLPGLRGDGLHAVASSDEARVRAALDQADFLVGVIEGRRVHDEASFFREAARALSLPEHFGANWDALFDALGDLGGAGRGRLAVLWRDAGRSLAGDVQTVLAAVQAFAFAASSAAELPDAAGPFQLEVFLLGDGVGFASLDR